MRYVICNAYISYLFFYCSREVFCNLSLHYYLLTKSRVVPLGHYLKLVFLSPFWKDYFELHVIFSFFLFFLNGPHSRIHLHGLMAYQMAIIDAFMWRAGQQICVHSLHADVRWPLVGRLPGLLACLSVGCVPSGSGYTSVLYRALYALYYTRKASDYKA